MQTQLTLNIDRQTVDLVSLHAKEKGLSLNEMIEFYLKWVVSHETSIQLSNVAPVEKEKNKSEKWKTLESFLTLNRFQMPANYKFNRDELYDR